jgi:hypothetical protein
MTPFGWAVAAIVGPIIIASGFVLVTNWREARPFISDEPEHLGMGVEYKEPVTFNQWRNPK